MPDTGARSLGEMFLAVAQRFPDRPCVWAAGQTLTYADLRNRAAAVGRSILRACSAADDIAATPIAVFAYRTAAAYAAVMGTLLAGSLYSPLNPRYPAERNRAILDASGASVMLVDLRCAAEASRVLGMIGRRLTVILLDGAELEPGLELRHDIRRADDPDGAARVAPCRGGAQGAYVLFTSGSTGAPKGVLVTHRNVLAYVSAIVRLFRLGCEDRFCHLADLTFDISVHDMFACWAAGACLYVVPEKDIAAPAAFVRAHGLTFWFSVPSAISFMDKFRSLPSGALPSLRCSLFCGEALFEDQAAIWHRAAPESAIYNLYGPTEATVAITVHPWSPAGAHPRPAVVPMGRPFPEQHVVLVDDRLVPVAPGDIGEVCLGGSQVAAGYWNEPARTEERFVRLEAPAADRWYRTGDLARWDERDGFVFHGRIDQQVKIRGFRVELEEVGDRPAQHSEH